jgi:hypothetical protein
MLNKRPAASVLLNQIPVGVSYANPNLNGTDCEEPPAGTVKSIIPCTPLAIVKCLEFIGIYI